MTNLQRRPPGSCDPPAFALNDLGVSTDMIAEIGCRYLLSRTSTISIARGFHLARPSARKVTLRLGTQLLRLVMVSAGSGFEREVPVPRQQFTQPVLRMACDVGQHMREPGVRIDVVQLRGYDQATPIRPTVSAAPLLMEWVHRHDANRDYNGFKRNVEIREPRTMTRECVDSPSDILENTLLFRFTKHC